MSLAKKRFLVQCIQKCSRRNQCSRELFRQTNFFGREHFWTRTFLETNISGEFRGTPVGMQGNAGEYFWRTNIFGREHFWTRTFLNANFFKTNILDANIFGCTVSRLESGRIVRNYQIRICLPKNLFCQRHVLTYER